MGGSVEAVTVHANHLYIGEGPTLAILDISSPTDPRPLGKTSLLPGFVRYIAAGPNHAYVVDTTGLLHIFDITDPAQPHQTATYQAAGDAYGVAVSGDLVYLAAGEAGLRIIDISQPAAPLEIGFLDTPGSARRVAIAAQIAYVADRGGGLRIVDIADPRSP
jgi:hypothetical protein